MRSNLLKITRSRLKEKVLACFIPIASMYAIFRYTVPYMDPMGFI